MKLIALADLPQGQRSGESFEASDDMGSALIRFGVAKRADDEPDSKSKRTYKRRDLVAEDTRHLSADDE